VLDADQVYVYGNVVKQQAVKMKEPLTLTQAIVKAEGLRGASVKDKVRVLRQKPGSSERQELVYNLNEINSGKQPDPLLEPDDIVAVSQDKTQSIINNLAKSLAGGAGGVFYRIP
jgi:protein involved in polysaccharide export with SLBB domain